jgi:hypothetical protein
MRRTRDDRRAASKSFNDIDDARIALAVRIRFPRIAGQVNVRRAQYRDRTSMIRKGRR